MTGQIPAPDLAAREVIFAPSGAWLRLRNRLLARPLNPHEHSTSAPRRLAAQHDVARSEAELERLARDKRAAKAEIYEAMERLADKHGISRLEINGVMLAHVDDALGDLTFKREEELQRERDEASESADPDLPLRD